MSTLARLIFYMGVAKKDAIGGSFFGFLHIHSPTSEKSFYLTLQRVKRVNLYHNGLYIGQKY